MMSFLQDYNYYFAYGLDAMFQINVVFRRFITILQIKDIRMIEVHKNTQSHQQQAKSRQTDIQDYAIVFNDFEGYWQIPQQPTQSQQQTNTQIKQKTPVVKNINANFEYGKIYGLCGPVASGRSSLLQAIAHQLPYIHGKVYTNGTISLCEQQPVLFEKTIKQNIVFGSEFDEVRYQKAISVSALNEDFQNLKDGQETMVGENGTTLSGGQRARVALARALYSQVEIYLLDDPLAAVNYRVARTIFDGIKRQLKGKTIIFNTHQTQFLQECDEIMVMKGGQIVKKEKKISMDELMKLIGKIQKIQNDETEEKNNICAQKNQLVGDNVKEEFAKRQQYFPQHDKDEKELKFGYKTFFKYFLYQSKWKFILAFIFFIFTQAIVAVYFRIYSYYDQQVDQAKLFHSDKQFWGLMAGLIVAYFVCLFVSFLFLNIMLLANNKKISKDMLMVIAYSKVSYFDVNNSGALINRFSNDIGVLDHAMVYSIEENICALAILIVAIANISQINIYFLILVFLLTVCIALAYIYFYNTTVQAKQLDLKSKNPIFKKLTEMTHGLKILQIYSNQSKYLTECDTLIDRSSRANLFVWFTIRICTYTIDIFSWIVTSVVLFAGITMIKDSGQYAVVALFLLQMINYLSWFIWSLINAQTMMVSTARCFDLISIPQEQIVIKLDQKLSQNTFHSKYTHYSLHRQYPTISMSNSDRHLSSNKMKSNLELKNFSFKYRQELPTVINNVNILIKGGQKIGIVGRTGAGKSSLIQAFLRMSEHEKGSIYEIGDNNALQMNLSILRNKFSVISQSPFLFEGTLRQNLNIENIASDENIWEALQRVKLANYILSLPQKLDTKISGSKIVLSVGQKQLFCLARTLLFATQFILLDQATQNLDNETDQLIQKVIKQNFASKTVITIAHRLRTIASSDFIYVMDKGQVKEKGKPYELLMRQNGIFFEMVQASKSQKQQIYQIAKEHNEKKSINYEQIF